MFYLSIYPYSKLRRIAGEYRSKYKFARFSFVLLSIHPRSRRCAERIGQGEGRWSRPTKTTLERIDLTGKVQFQESHTETERMTKSGPNPGPLKKRIVICIYVYSRTQREYVLCYPNLDLPPPRNFSLLANHRFLSLDVLEATPIGRHSVAILRRRKPRRGGKCPAIPVLFQPPPSSFLSHASYHILVT